VETIEAARRAAERRAREAGEPIRYPTFEEMRAEDREERRIAWNLRRASASPVDETGSFDPFDDGPDGPLVVPGSYRVTLGRVEDGTVTQLTQEGVEFQVVPLNNATLATDDRDALLAFQMEADALMARVRVTTQQMQDIAKRLVDVKTAIQRSPNLPLSALEEARALEYRAADLQIELSGDRSVAARQFETPPSISGRVSTALYSSFDATSAPTGQQREQIAIAERDLDDLQPRIDALAGDVVALEDRLRGLGAPLLPRGGD
jgi:hypothetical protein